MLLYELLQLSPQTSNWYVTVVEDDLVWLKEGEDTSNTQVLVKSEKSKIINVHYLRVKFYRYYVPLEKSGSYRDWYCHLRKLNPHGETKIKCYKIF